MTNIHSKPENLMVKIKTASFLSFYLHVNKFRSLCRHARSHSFVSAGPAPRHWWPAAWRRQETHWNAEHSAVCFEKGEVFISRLRKYNDRHEKNEERKIPSNLLYFSEQKKKLSQLFKTVQELNASELNYQNCLKLIRFPAFPNLPDSQSCLFLLS